MNRVIKNKEINLNEYFFGKDLIPWHIEDFTNNNGEVTTIVDISSTQKDCCCPKCGEIANRLAGGFVRSLQTVPFRWKNKTILKIHGRKAFCDNSNCDVKQFEEQFEQYPKYSRRTFELDMLILGIMLLVSNSGTVMILKQLGISVSEASLRRLMSEYVVVDDPDVEAIGVDDVATRKGQNYATVIYRLKDHGFLDLLDGREAKPLEEWLKKHPRINLVTRDRASSYATAISNILSNCVQVADRFHLFQNILEHLDDIFKAELPSEIAIKDNEILDHVPQKINYFDSYLCDEDYKSIKYDNTPPVDENGEIIIVHSQNNDSASKASKKFAAKRKEKYETIKMSKVLYYESQLKIKEISEKLSISPPTVSKYIKMTQEEMDAVLEKKEYSISKKNKLVPYSNIIYKMMRDGYNDTEILIYLTKYRQCEINQNTIMLYLNAFRHNNSNLPMPIRKAISKQEYSDDIIVLSKSRILKAITTIEDEKKDKIVDENLMILIQRYPVIKEVQNCFKEFHDIIMGNDPDKLDSFIKKYESRNHLKGFCNRLKQDIVPVKNAISCSESSGFVEGNNNKFKTIKRIVYGRIELVNLKKRCGLAFSLTKLDFSLREELKRIKHIV